MNFSFYKLFLFCFSKQSGSKLLSRHFEKVVVVVWGIGSSKNKPGGILSFLGELRNKTEVSLLLPLYS